ncbi:unnamed protein product [Dibothriocephalus latus]|uniref:Uncharacterized protein n=1 Tax=Dibothriocephalus latus TaxID=60516 RepID=A0A3P7NZ51_DIBLA|nr:unnamed protein product [Dibothriocephalus latus]
MGAGDPVTHIIFDLDGLLISTEEIYTEVISELLSKYEKTYTYEVKRKLMGRKALEAAAIMVKEYDLPISPQELTDELHSKITPETWHKATLLPGAAALFEYFHSHGLPMAVASGSVSWEIEAKMFNNKEVWSKLHHIVSSGDDPEVKHGKPAPDIFLVALRRFDDPSAEPSNTLVFEDAWNGVAAGLAAGMRVVWVPDKREPQGIPDSSLSQETISRLTRLTSLEQFDPTLFGLPPKR